MNHRCFPRRFRATADWRENKSVVALNLRGKPCVHGPNAGPDFGGCPSPQREERVGERRAVFIWILLSPLVPRGGEGEELRPRTPRTTRIKIEPEPGAISAAKSFPQVSPRLSGRLSPNEAQRHSPCFSGHSGNPNFKGPRRRNCSPVSQPQCAAGFEDVASRGRALAVELRETKTRPGGKAGTAEASDRKARIASRPGRSSNRPDTAPV